MGSCHLIHIFPFLMCLREGKPWSTDLFCEQDVEVWGLQLRCFPVNFLKFLLSTLLKKRFRQRCFLEKFAKFSRTPFFHRTPWGDSVCTWLTGNISYSLWDFSLSMKKGLSPSSSVSSESKENTTNLLFQYSSSRLQIHCQLKSQL